MARTLVEIFENSFRLYPDNLALRWRHDNVFKEMTYRELEENAKAFGAALINLGVKFQQHVGLIADVSHHWTLSDFAVQLIGAVDVPRGTDSTAEELGFIIDHAGCDIVLVHYP